MKTIARLSCLVLAAGGVWSCSGSGETSLTGPSPDQSSTRPSSLAGMVVFTRGSNNALMAMNADGSGVVSLGVNGWHPSVSPDGRKLAYTAASNEAIGVLDLVTGQTAQLAQRLSVGAKWSPDGSKILFWSDRSGTKELYTMNADGSGVSRLSDGTDGYHEGHWSPDGKRIVFRRVQADGGDIWVMNADGTGAAVLYAAPGMQSVPRWSPDGSRIAFIGTVFQGPTVVTSDVYVMNADGTNAKRLTTGATENWWPSWAPDGSKIAFFGIRTGSISDLYTISADGTDLKPLLVDSTNDYGPEYGPAR